MRRLLLTFSNPADPSLEAEYNDWYVARHIPQLLKHVSKIKRAWRYRVDNEKFDYKYLVIYEFEGNSSELMDEISQRRSEGKVERFATLGSAPPPLMIVAHALDDGPFSVTNSS